MARITLILTVLTTIIALLGGFKLLMNELRDLRDHKRLTGRWFALALLLCAPDLAEAACSGSGLTWSCTSGSSMTDITNAYNSGTDGMTVTLQAGTYSWTGGLTITSTKGITLICAATPPSASPWGANESTGCNVTTNSRVMSGFNDYNTPKGTVTALYRISGVNFTSNTSDRVMSLICTCTFANIRIDHNSFGGANTPGKVLYFGGGDAQANIQYVNGVLDHNKLRGSASYWLVDALAGQDNAAYPIEQRGTGNNIFVEDNDLLFTTRAGDMNCLDWQGTGGIVFRYNTVVNCRTILHGVLHGGGPSNWEVYGNTYTLNANIPADSCFGCINHQGSGESYVWANGLVATQPLSAAIRIQHYRSGTGAFNPSTTCNGSQGIDGNRAPTGTYQGYPCWRQPGRNFAGTLRPMYAWMNVNSSTLAKVDLEAASNGGSPDYFGLHLVANRDYYNAVSASAQTTASSPFNGTTGMGFGTLANRPTTCTTTPDAADAGKGGVGYWATDGGTNWNISNGTGNDGALYVCTSTNTWSVYYTPYTYPHPLIGGTPPVEPEPPPVTRFYLRFAELLLVLGSFLWKGRATIMTGGLLLAHAGTTSYHAARLALPEMTQRTVYHGKVMAAKVLLSVLPKKSL